MKETNCCTDVAGEDFSAAIEEGCKYSPPDSSPFQRSLAHVEARRAKVEAGNTKGDFRDYDERETTNQA